MANASADKLKSLGIRHGEKAVVGITAIVFVALVVIAILNPVLDIQPDQLRTDANRAKSNLDAKQNDSDILAKLEKDGLKEPNFQKVIEGQISNALKPDNYRARLDWVSPEPGAGLIRDQPELIAPTELTAFPGRGGITIFSLDDNGERIIDTGAEAKNGNKLGRPGGVVGAAPGGAGGGNDNQKKETAEEKRRRLAEEERRKGIFAGNAAKPEEKKEDDAAPNAPPQGPFKEEVKGKRWVVITAVLDNEKLKKNYLMALKNEAIAYPNFKRVDVERQTLQSDGSWSEWAATEMDKNWAVLDNLPEYDEEFVPESKRIAALVDPLPFLKAGYWAGVHVAKLVPSEIINKKADAPPAGNNMPGGGMLMGGPGPMGGSPPGGGSVSRQQGGGKKMGGMGMGMGMGMEMGGGGPGAPGGGGPSDDMNFTKSDDPALMIRSLDFTIEPDHTYRFRIRIVVHNPNFEHTDVNPGVDVDSPNLSGPWSEPSPIVTVPADVVAYAQAPEQAERRDDLVNFQVVRWDPASGQTVIKNDTRGPGEIIGEYTSVQMPNSDGNGPKSERIDFNSRAIVLDTVGGRQKLPDIGVTRNNFEVPAMAMLVQPNGDVVIRTQALDRSDEVREDMELGYKQAIEDSGKKRERGGNDRMTGLNKGGKKKSGARGGSRQSPGGGASRQGGGSNSSQGS